MKSKEYNVTHNGVTKRVVAKSTHAAIAETIRQSLVKNLAATGATTGYVEHGMTLRDYFAGQALAGAMAVSSDMRAWPHNQRDPKAAIADAVYSIADAMIAARGGAK